MTRLACNWYCILLLDFTYDYIYHCYYITLVVLASITLHTLSIGKGISDCVGNMTVNTESIYWKHLLSKSKQYFLKLLVIQICFIESPPPPPPARHQLFLSLWAGASWSGAATFAFTVLAPDITYTECGIQHRHLQHGCSYVSWVHCVDSQWAGSQYQHTAHCPGGCCQLHGQSRPVSGQLNLWKITDVVQSL